MRNYDKELADTADHEYAYDFDFDVMHHFMIRAFKPFLREGNSLELGSFKGDFTWKLKEQLGSVECVEASAQAIQEFKKRSSLNDVVCHHSLFEEFKTANKYENIFLTHVLEHIDDPKALLETIKNEWLSDNGRFFLVCPNANAPSRQIAVRMGLISHNAAVTDAEKAHGHNATYSFDTLERIIREAGLKVTVRKGVFFKCLANFQWDRVIAQDIVSKDYLDACYELGEIYPDLCSSIMLVCEK